jgi:ATP-binding cassette subfamily F protein 3
VLLNVSGVSKAFGPDIVLEGVSFRLNNREKVALVGRNGTGKTTLLRIITGQYEPDSGSVHLASGAKIGYLRQEAPVSLGRTVLEEAQEAVEHRLQLKDRLEEIEKELEHNPQPPTELLDEYALLHEHFLEAEGYSAETDLKVVLGRMGFTEDEFDKSTSSLSGGEKTRLALAKMLLEEPDLLILDEPTNHLDLQATEWLEGWIKAYHGAVLLVSHDRTFLQNTAERVLEVRDHTVKAYPGPFEKYLKLKAEEEARQAEVARRQELEIAKLDEYVRRFMNSQRTAQARGRQKLMTRLIESKVSAPKAEKGMKGGFGDVKRSGDIVVATERLTVGFPGVTLIKGLDWTVRLGERWGVIGENGAGKSTLIKVLLNELEPLSGRAKLGAGVAAGYFSQDASDLELDQSPLDSLVYDCDLLPAEARNLLGRFLITGDDVYRPIKTLSGGEKNKLSLARLTTLNPNLLVLDEPTNHLDMASREALAEVLNDYKGTLILVSHDRWLLGQVTTETLDIRREGAVIYPGSYDEYRLRLLSGRPLTVQKKAPEKPVEQELSPRELSKEIERLRKLVSDLEGDISRREANVKEIESQLAALPSGADILKLTREHQETQEALEGTMAVWEEQSLKLEELQRLQGATA